MFFGILPFVFCMALYIAILLKRHNGNAGAGDGLALMMLFLVCYAAAILSNLPYIIYILYLLITGKIEQKPLFIIALISSTFLLLLPFIHVIFF